MSNCAKLKWNRKAKGLTQKQFADLVGLNVSTISKLEKDETAWLTIRPETEEKIYAQYTSMHSWQPDRPDKVLREINDDVEKEDEVMEEKKESVWPKHDIFYEPVKEIHNGLTEQDEKTKTLIEFAYEGLTEAKTHEEFVANINIIRRVLNRY